MRIAFVSDAAYPWNVGGLETLERAEAEALAVAHEVHFFSFRWPGMKPEFASKGIHYHTFHPITKEKFYRHHRRSIREALVFAAGMLRIFRYRFDVIQANEFPILHLPLLRLYCALAGCRLIVDTHEVWDRGYWTTYIGAVPGLLAFHYANFCLKGASHYISNASKTEADLRGLGIERGRITTFSPVIDDVLMRGLCEPRQKKQIIFAGRMIKEKRIDKWLLALKRLNKASRVRGVLIGEGPEESRIRRMIRRMSLQSVVEFRGFYKDKRRLYRRIKESSLLLHMSEREGLSLIALESLALGTPVLLPDYSPIPVDVSAMCVVEPEEKIPEAAQRILGGPKANYIRNPGLVERFYLSRISGFYETLFSKLFRHRE